MAVRIPYPSGRIPGIWKALKTLWFLGLACQNSSTTFSSFVSSHITMMLFKLLITGCFILFAQVLVAQKLKHFSFEQDDLNPHKFLLERRIDRIVKTGDSLFFEITWLDHCGLAPKIKLDRVNADTLYFLKIDDREGNSFSPCAYKCTLLVTQIRYPVYQVVFGRMKVDGNKKRYRADACIVEYYPGKLFKGKIRREIYSEGGAIFAEVFYDSAGRMEFEKYYLRGWGILSRERKY